MSRAGEHHGRGAAIRARVVVLTVSDTRTPDDDTSGRTVADRLVADRHRVAGRAIVPDDRERIAAAVLAAVRRDDCDAVLLTGGTGVSARDTTHEAIAGLIDKRLDGFGELFRMLSWEEIGSAAMLSRAIAGIVSGKPVFAMPGSTAAVRLAMDRLILPELAHVLRELGKHRE